jgi:hypothetical protein
VVNSSLTPVFVLLPGVDARHTDLAQQRFGASWAAQKRRLGFVISGLSAIRTLPRSSNLNFGAVVLEKRGFEQLERASDLVFSPSFGAAECPKQIDQGADKNRGRQKGSVHSAEMRVVEVAIPKVKVGKGSKEAQETNHTISYPPTEVGVPHSHHDASSLLVPRRSIEVVPYKASRKRGYRKLRSQPPSNLPKTGLFGKLDRNQFMTFCAR